MSNVEYSRVPLGFLLAYTIINGASGLLIDRMGTRLGYALFMVWWSVAEVLHAFARGALSLGAFRFLLGAGEAGNWPGTVKVVAEWFPEQERAGLRLSQQRIPSGRDPGASAGGLYSFTPRTL